MSDSFTTVILEQGHMKQYTICKRRTGVQQNTHKGIAIGKLFQSSLHINCGYEA